jgi:hypothetical protein
MIKLNNTLYIFSTSFNPDVYINAIVHYLNIGSTEKVNIEVITVFEDAVERNKLENKYRNTIEKIEIVLDNLGKGEYHTTDGDRNERTVILEEDDKSFYRQSKIKINGRIIPRSILYAELEEEMIRIINNQDDKFIFDLSGERKYLLVDIVFISLANNCKELFVFDILREPDFKLKERNLIHSLGGNDYKFRNLFSTQYVTDSIIKLSQGKDIELSTLTEKALNIIDFSADKFAKGILLALFALVSTLLLIILRYQDIIKDKWNELEPIAFIYISISLPILYFLASIGVAFLFTKELELTPKAIYESVKKYRFNKLRNKYLL